MAVNLVGQMGRAAARDLLESSFAQFQADRGVAGLARQIKRNEATLREYEQQMHCHLGDFAEYAALRRELSDARVGAVARGRAERRRGAVAATLEALRPGDVIRVPQRAARRAGDRARPRRAPARRPAPAGASPRRAGRAGCRCSTSRPRSRCSDTCGCRSNVNHRSPQERRDLASSLRALNLPDAPRGRRRRPGRLARPTTTRCQRLRAALRAHPCHGCPDREQHARWAERAARLEREIEGLRRRIEGRTTSLGRTFDRICRLLDERGYLAGDETTPPGRQLARIWSEADLVVAECLRDGAWDGLDPAELAAVVSTMVYEARREERAVDRMPSAAVREALADDGPDLGRPRRRRGRDRPAAEPRARVGLRLGDLPLGPRRAARPGAERAAGPARAGAEMSAGDFIRWCKQVLDLLEQLASAPSAGGGTPPVAAPARAAAQAIRRGVVAQSMAP